MKKQANKIHLPNKQMGFLYHTYFSMLFYTKHQMPSLREKVTCRSYHRYHRDVQRKTYTERRTRKESTRKDVHGKTYTERCTRKESTQKAVHGKTYTERRTRKESTQKDVHRARISEMKNILTT